MDRNTLLNLEGRLMVLKSDVDDILKTDVKLVNRTTLNFMKDDLAYCLRVVQNHLSGSTKPILTIPTPVGNLPGTVHPVRVNVKIEQPPRDLSFEETEEEAQKFDEFLGGMGFKRKEEDSE